MSDGLMKKRVLPEPEPPITMMFLFLAYLGCLGRLSILLVSDFSDNRGTHDPIFPDALYHVFQTIPFIEVEKVIVIGGNLRDGQIHDCVPGFVYYIVSAGNEINRIVHDIAPML